jgi:hypothetical protein
MAYAEGQLDMSPWEQIFFGISMGGRKRMPLKIIGE